MCNPSIIATLDQSKEIAKYEMQKLVTFLICLVIFIGCFSKKTEEKSYPNGNLEYKVETKNGRWNGRMYTYYESGKIESEQEWKDGKRDGKSIEYYESGEIKGKAHYLQDSLNGIYERYYKNGNLRGTGEYRNGKKIGLHKVYYENGTLQETQLYDSTERLMNFDKYDTVGKPFFDERFAIFYPEKDTIQLGDKYKAEVRLSSRAYNENKMIIGSFTENYEVEDTVEVLTPQNYVFYYDTVPQDTGMHLITGHIHDIDHHGDSTIIDIIPFQQNFYVTHSIDMN